MSVTDPRTFARYCELQAAVFDASAAAAEGNPYLTDEQRRLVVAHCLDFAAQYRRMPAQYEEDPELDIEIPQVPNIMPGPR